MKINRLLYSTLLYTLLLMPTYTAKAELEYWQGFSAVLPLTEYENSQLKFQSFTLAQLAPRFDGIGVLRFSNGPL